ncbi:DUF4253 domain-containing protein [Catenulispora subtropica]|uniref:DUF4253 domain-containing protein n=1 Tax=Catenulispora subtropica TaxID=450798 RepID=A0ABN2S1J5_9ACTN
MKDLTDSAVVLGTLADGTEVLAVTVEAGTARQAWEALRERHAETGLWPFLIDQEGPTLPDRLPAAGTVRERHRGAAEIFARASLMSIVFHDGPERAENAESLSAAEATATSIGLIAAEWGGVEIPGLLDWDGAPGVSGLEHTAVLADWHRRFGAQLLTLTRDRIELEVPRPPRDGEEVKAVAGEQVGYCQSVPFQASGPRWSFHWR